MFPPLKLSGLVFAFTWIVTTSLEAHKMDSFTSPALKGDYPVAEATAAGPVHAAAPSTKTSGSAIGR